MSLLLSIFVFQHFPLLCRLLARPWLMPAGWPCYSMSWDSKHLLCLRYPAACFLEVSLFLCVLWISNGLSWISKVPFLPSSNIYLRWGLVGLGFWFLQRWLPADLGHVLVGYVFNGLVHLCTRWRDLCFRANDQLIWKSKPQPSREHALHSDLVILWCCWAFVISVCIVLSAGNLGSVVGMKYCAARSARTCAHTVIQVLIKGNCRLGKGIVRSVSSPRVYWQTLWNSLLECILCSSSCFHSVWWKTNYGKTVWLTAGKQITFDYGDLAMQFRFWQDWPGRKFVDGSLGARVWICLCFTSLTYPSIRSNACALFLTLCPPFGLFVLPHPLSFSLAAHSELCFLLFLSCVLLTAILHDRACLIMQDPHGKCFCRQHPLLQLSTEYSAHGGATSEIPALVRDSICKCPLLSLSLPAHSGKIWCNLFNSRLTMQHFLNGIKWTTYVWLAMAPISSGRLRQCIKLLAASRLFLLARPYAIKAGAHSG